MLYAQAARDFERGDLAAASREAQDGFQRSQKLDITWNYKFRILLANVYLWKGGGLRSQAIQLLDTPPPPELATGEFAARRKALQGSLLTFQDKFEEARLRLAEAEALALNGAPGVESEVLLNQGTLAIREDKPEAARGYLLRALPLARANHRRWIETQIRGSLGLIDGRHEHYGDAIAQLDESLTAAQSIDARQLQATTLLNLAWMHSAIGDFDDAIRKLNEAENLAENVSLKEIIQNNLGEVYRNQEQYSQAWEEYSKARELAANNPGYTEGLIDCLSGLAWVALAQGHLTTAEPLEGEAQKVLSGSKNPDPSIATNLQLLHADLLRAAGHPDQAEEVLLSLLGQQLLPSDRWQADSELANVYVETHKDTLAGQQFEKVLKTLDSARASLNDVEQRLAFSSRESLFYKNYVEFLVSTGRQFEAFRVADRIRARTLKEAPNSSAHETAQLSLPALQVALGRRKQVLLTYWLAPKRSFVWIVTSSRFQMFELPSSGALDQQIEAYFQGMVNGKGLQDAAGQDGADLYKILVMPLQKLIPPNADIVIVPDGRLATLNFETLIVPGASPHYWIDDVTVSNAVSVAALTRHTPSKHPPQDMLAIGDPVNESGSPALRHAKEEVNMVASYASATSEDVITGKDATPPAYAASHPERFRRIHFAAHGVSNQIKPLESAILLSPEGDNSNKLYGRDIVKLKLNAELVTISSCKGGEGRIYGEGSVGLAWAFMKAGAHQVVAALWNLDDAAAAELMKAFYDGLNSGKTPAAALRAAKLSLMKDPNHQRPYYWATLQLYLGS